MSTPTGPGGFEPPAYGSQDPQGYGPPQGYGSQPQGSPPQGYGSAPQGYGPPPGPVGWSGPPLASWGIRVGGYLIDWAIAVGIYLVVSLISRGLASAVLLLIFYVGYGYLDGTKGQTPGKQVVGIKLLREQDGQLLGAGAGIGRKVLHIIEFVIGFLWPLWDPKRQTFADKIIKSVVVKV